MFLTHYSLRINEKQSMTNSLAIADSPNLTQATQTLPPSSSSTVLDDGCGLGTVTAEVKKSFPDLPILAIDSSAGMLEIVEQKAKKHDWKNVETKLLDGGDLSGIFVFPHPSQPAPHSNPRFIPRSPLLISTPKPITSR